MTPGDASLPVKTDAVIIGAGPVGLFAVFECGMLGLKCHVVDALESVGGQLSALYPEKPIYDIPGYPRIDAQDLVKKLEEQAAPFAPVFHLSQQVTGLAQQSGGWRVTTDAGAVIDAAAVIIAAGVGAFGPNRPPLDGIEDYEGQGAGQGVNYLVSRVDDYKDKRIVIAGGGDSAVDWALALADHAKSLAVVHRRAKFRAAPESVRRMQDLAKAGAVDMVVPYQLAALEGAGGTLAAVVVSDLGGNEKRLPADVLLPFYGLSQNLGPIADWGLDLAKDLIQVDAGTMGAGKPGLFAVGDIVTYPGKLKLILTGFAEAALAAHGAHAVARPGEILHFEYSTTKGVPGGDGK
ncbi:MAG: NAD(P)/FAD-dependent oxidoreductase [Rhodospirillaceae bacterium]